MQINTEKLREQLAAAGIDCRMDEPLSRHTTFEIGGSARLFALPKNERELAAALAAARAQAVPYMLLGRGSNVLFRDEGYPGLVLHPCGVFCGISVDAQKGQITAGAGAALQDVCQAARDAALAGLEFAYGIPGSVGGAIYMNAGAYGGEMRDVVASVCFLDEHGEVRTLPAEELAFRYRHSVFQDRGWVILSAGYALKAGQAGEIGRLMEEHMQARRDKQPLDLPSAGSAFKRPNGAYASALIDQCGLRGYRVGGAAVSQKHCGFIVNMGGATCADVLALIAHVVDVVRDKTGFVLEPEPRILPDKPAEMQ